VKVPVFNCAASTEDSSGRGVDSVGWVTFVVFSDLLVSNGMEQIMDWLQIIGALGVGGLLGTFGQQWMTGRREKAARTNAFKKQQLEEFYGPLLAMRKEIRARSELRVKLQEAVGEYVQDMRDASVLGHVVGVMDANVQEA
jgi:hypothetical protein